MRGTAVEQVNVSRDRKPGSSRYWYTARICRRAYRNWEMRILKEARLFYGFPPQFSTTTAAVDGKDSRELGESLGTKCPLPEPKNAKAFGTKLLRKRSGYQKYFESSLSKIDSALRRVQVRRSMDISAEDRKFRPVRDGSAPTESVPLAPVTWKLVIVGKTSLKECRRKEKVMLKKYASAVRDRLSKRVAKENERVSAFTRRTEEKRLAECRERSRLAALDRASLRARNENYPVSVIGRHRMGEVPSTGMSRTRLILEQTRAQLDAKNKHNRRGRLF